jgi:uncharacterized protein HemY
MKFEIIALVVAAVAVAVVIAQQSTKKTGYVQANAPQYGSTYTDGLVYL